MNDEITATVDFGVEQAKKRLKDMAADAREADLQIVLLAQIRDCLMERRTLRRRAITAIPWAGLGTGVGSFMYALLQTMGN